MELKEQIKAEAGRLGFLISGVSLPQEPPHYQVYRQWLADGRHAAMDYLARTQQVHQRADPRTLHPAARSIVVPCSTLPAAFQNSSRDAACPDRKNRRLRLLPGLS